MRLARSCAGATRWDQRWLFRVAKESSRVKVRRQTRACEDAAAAVASDSLSVNPSRPRSQVLSGKRNLGGPQQARR
jgi:hypothetical protein